MADATFLGRCVLLFCPLPADDGTQRKEPQREEASKSIGRADVSEAVLLPILLFGGGGGAVQGHSGALGLS